MARPDARSLSASGLDPFLHSGGGVEAIGSELMVLSILARLGLDPSQRVAHASWHFSPTGRTNTNSDEVIDMRMIVSTVLLSLVVMPALGDDVPFAERTPTATSPPSELRSSSLGELMSLTQSRHIKLWFAGRSGNWDLALYTLNRIGETLDKTTMLYQNIPTAKVVEFEKPLAALHAAIGRKSVTEFKRGFSDLTAACNECHRSAGIGFIAMKKPTSSPFGDQDFDPTAPK